MAGGGPWQEGIHARGMHGGTCVAGEGMHGRGDGHCSGWHVTYWNAFLFYLILAAKAAVSLA